MPKTTKNTLYFWHLSNWLLNAEFSQSAHGEGKVEREKLPRFFFKKTAATNKQDFLKELIGELVYHSQVEWHSYSH